MSGKAFSSDRNQLSHPLKDANMIPNLIRTLAAATAMLGFAGSLSLTQAQAPKQIMPLGDSITAGVDGGITVTSGGYRDPLYSDLVAAGISFTFVGVNNNVNNNGSATRQLIDANQTSNNGFGGYWISDLDNNLNGVANPQTGGAGNQGGYWFTGGNGTGRNAVTPDIVLLQIGTNDVIHGNPVTTMETQLQKLVEDIHTLSPGSKIIIAGIPPTNSTSFNSTISTYNSWISSNLVPTHSSYTSYVDNNTALLGSGGVANPLLLGGTSATGGDGIHPSREGYTIIGSHFATAIESVLGVTPATNTLNVVNGTINNGGTSGSYPPGSVVALVSTGSFGSWSGSNYQATSGLENPFSSVSSFVMPAGGATVTANAATANLVPNGTYYLIGASDLYRMSWTTGPNGLPMTAAGSTTGSIVQLQTQTGAALQKWVVTNGTNNQIQLSPSGTSLALEPVGGSTANSTNVDVETVVTGSAAQLWTVSPLYGTTELLNVNSGIALYINPYTLQLSQNDQSVNPPVAGGQYANSQAFAFYPAPASAPPAPPTSLTASTSVSGQVSLSWTGSTGATSYTVYRGTSGTGLANLSVIATGLTSTSFVDKALTGPAPAPTGLTPSVGVANQVGLTWTAGSGGTNNTTYDYEVVAVGAGGPSGGSNDASATPSGGPAVTSYNVYRTTNQYQYYLYTTPIANGVTTTSYTDTTATASGGPYYYTVAAVSITGVGTGSNQATATPTSGGGSAPVISSGTSASGTVGTAFSYQITASNSPTSFSASGLPGGLSINTSNGLISGTPTAAGTSTVTLGATNASGTGNAFLTVTISVTKPVISSSTSASGTAGSSFSYQIVATNSPTNYSATGLPSGLAVNTSTGLISGTPAGSGTSTITLGATNAGGTGNATLTLTVSAAGGSAPAITSSTSAAATVGAAFSYQIVASNTPTSYGASGLPSGLSINTSTGSITGTPTASGTSTVTLSATNSTGTGSATLTLTVSAAGTGTSIGVQFIGGGAAMASTDSAGVPAVAQTNWKPVTGSTFSNVALTDNSGGATTALLNGGADGGYFSASGFAMGSGDAHLCSGELFDGNINTETNSITISSIPYGTYDVYIYAESDAGGRNATFTVTPSGGAASSKSFQTESNGSTWTEGTNTWNGSGTAPTLAVANYVHFTGLTASSFNLKFGGINNVSMNGIQIVKTSSGGGGSAPVITSGTSASGTVGTAFSYQIAASNSPTSYNATGLPSGLAINSSTGLISGTPTASGTSTITLGATNASGTGNASLTLTVSVAKPVITSATTASGTAGSVFSYQITATNSPTSFSATGLPSGLSINTSTGAITGTPAASGTSTIALGATNAGGTGNGTLTLTVSAAGTGTSIAVQFVGGGAAMASTDSAGVPAVAQTNWKPVTGSTFSNVALTDNSGGATTALLNGSADGAYFSASGFATGSGDAHLCSGELYDGNINTETNSITISSIPYGTYDVYIYAESDAGTRNATFTITPSGGAASSKSFQTESSGSTWTEGTNTWNGSGTAPTLAVANYVHFTGLTASSFNLKFGGINNVSMNGIQIVKTSSGGSAPSITSATTASGTVGSAFSYQITAANSPTSYSATGLPAGLNINTATGAISGTPTTAGTSTITLGATNANGTGNATLTLTVSAGVSAPVINSVTSASGTVGSAFSYQITATNSATSYGASGLPAGLSINTATGLISGTPTATGTSSVSLSATNSGGTGTATLTLTVSAVGAQKSIAMQFVGLGTALTSTTSAGVPAVAQTNWQPLTGSSFSSVILKDNSGATSTATISGGSDGSYFSGSSFTATGDANLSSGELYDGAMTTETNAITIASIPYAQYDIYIYGECDAGGRNATFSVTPSGGATSYQSFQTESNGSTWTAGTSTWNGSGTAPTVPAGNYVKFSGLTATSVVIKFGGAGNVGMNGIQIVKTGP
jgi:lysophospholipase L1-like esterase/fibronectin type 3 domain-containing protein